jgi:hypothetical protein
MSYERYIFFSNFIQKYLLGTDKIHYFNVEAVSGE